MKNRQEAYEAAVTYAKGVIGDWLASASTEDTQEAVLLRFTLGVKQMVWMNGASYTDAPDQSLEFLAETAVSQQVSRNLLLEIVSTKLLCGRPLNDTERNFAGKALAGYLPRLKKKAGKQAGKYFWRTAAAVLLAQDLVEKFGLYKTRNDEVMVERSACDAVVEAFRAAGVALSFNTVKAAVLDPKLKSEIDAVLDAIRQQGARPAALRAGLLG